MRSKVLITGSSGKLGKRVLEFNEGLSFLSPSSKDLDITSETSVNKFLNQNSFNTIIHCAALARMMECEENPNKAFLINTQGTLNLVNKVRDIEKSCKTNIRFIYISTDGVYPCINGNYDEDSPTIPYNIYGWSKLGGETTVRSLENFCIIRTRFFDPLNIPFSESADDIITSSIEIDRLAKIINFLVKDEFNGVLNVGNEATTEFLRYISHKPNLKKCKRSDITKNLNFEIAKNASMNISLMKKILNS